jgi:transposase
VFLAQLQTYRCEQLVYVDEAGVDDTEDYAYGWCHQSQRFEADKLGHRTCRISMIAGWCNRRILAPLTFQGYCDTAWVEAWVEQFLVPELQPGQGVVIDNASFHKSSRMRTLIEQAGCTLLFLPAYSPDLSKIEKFWARLKHYLRQTLHQFEHLWDAVDNAFRALS